MDPTIKKTYKGYVQVIWRDVQCVSVLCRFKKMITRPETQVERDDFRVSSSSRQLRHRCHPNVVAFASISIRHITNNIQTARYERVYNPLHVAPALQTNAVVSNTRNRFEGSRAVSGGRGQRGPEPKSSSE